MGASLVEHQGVKSSELPRTLDIGRGPLIQARFVAMLLLVYHHLGDSWKSAREASTSRLLCFTTGFPGAPKGSPLQLFPNFSNAVHRCGCNSVTISTLTTQIRTL